MYQVMISKIPVKILDLFMQACFKQLEVNDMFHIKFNHISIIEIGFKLKIPDNKLSTSLLYSRLIHTKFVKSIIFVEYYNLNLIYKYYLTMFFCELRSFSTIT